MKTHFRGDFVTDEFAEQMVVLAEACGGSISPDRIRTYALLLHDLPIAQVRAAVYRCSRERDQKFLPADKELRVPTVAELRQHVVTSETDAALQAWAGLQRAAQDVGAYASLDVDEAATAEALLVVFGSWAHFCDMEEGPGLTSKRAEFLAAYKEARRQLTYHGPVRLPGHCQLGDARRVFAGRLTARGHVQPVQDRPALAGAERKALK